MRAALFVLLALLPAPALAQIRPQPGSGDPRIQSVLYNPQQVVQLQVAQGYQLAVEFASGERIENVAVGDSGAWQVTPNKRGDLLFIKPVAGGVSTNMTVVTDARAYVFELVPAFGPAPDMAFTVRFTYPAPAAASVVPPDVATAVRYRLSGDRALRPVAMEDDGAKTYLEFGPDQPLPAIFMIDGDGKETLADGSMREGLYVIDGVGSRLIFRRDDDEATATRLPPKKAQP